MSMGAQIVGIFRSAVIFAAGAATGWVTSRVARGLEEPLARDDEARLTTGESAVAISMDDAAEHGADATASEPVSLETYPRRTLERSGAAIQREADSSLSRRREKEFRQTRKSLDERLRSTVRRRRKSA